MSTPTASPEPEPQRISATELQRQLGECLARVRWHKQSFEVTKRGRVVAVLAPPANRDLTA